MEEGKVGKGKGQKGVEWGRKEQKEGPKRGWRELEGA